MSFYGFIVDDLTVKFCFIDIRASDQIRLNEIELAPMICPIDPEWLHLHFTSVRVVILKHFHV